MKMLLKILLVIAGILLLGGIVGWLLPRERVVVRQGHFDTSPEILFGIVTDNSDWQYRSGLKDLVVVETADGSETWDEYTEDGSVIRFRTREKQAASFYSFDMQAKRFTGTWTGEFEPDGEGGTRFTATEYVRVKNPFVKVLSYLFFDVGRLMETYQDDLREKVAGLPPVIVKTKFPQYPVGTDAVGLVVTNNSGREICTGEYYLLYRKVDDAWEVIPLSLFFNDIAYILSPGGSRNFSIPLPRDQFAFPAGEYRIGKEVDGKEFFAGFRLLP